MKATVTSKGQVTIPLAIRAKAKIVAGSQLEFQIEDDDTITVHLVTHDVTDLKGLVKSARRRPPSLHEMKQAIAEGASSSRAKKDHKR